MTDIGRNITRLREARDISQMELAQRTGVSGPMICQIERGKKMPSVLLTVEIAKVLECSVDDIVAEQGA